MAGKRKGNGVQELRKLRVSESAIAFAWPIPQGGAGAWGTRTHSRIFLRNPRGVVSDPKTRVVTAVRCSKEAFAQAVADSNRAGASGARAWFALACGYARSFPAVEVSRVLCQGCG